MAASLGGLYVIATRMSAGIVHLRGYDVSTEEVRSAVLRCLLGAAGASTLKRAGVEIGKKSTVAALRKVPGRVLIEINKEVGSRLVTKAGEKGIVNLTKLVPLVGGPIGATHRRGELQGDRRLCQGYVPASFADTVVIDELPPRCSAPDHAAPGYGGGSNR